MPPDRAEKREIMFWCFFTELVEIYNREVDVSWVKKQLYSAAGVRYGA
jgi:hypothetical protein